ncbi:MAG: hypothetical protein N3G19_00150 [Candidatus Pacearchaeota archaeon]|nr:hypothetical protein [Candidatus Pacearchaeota archaeon]
MNLEKKVTRREFFKKAIGAIGVFLPLFGKEAFIEEGKRKLEAIMEKALKQKGARIASHYFYIDFKVPKKPLKVNLYVDKPDDESLRFVIFPELWKENVNLKKVDIYLVTPYKSRFEYEDFFVFLSKPDNKVNYVPCSMDYEGKADLVINKNAKIAFDLLNKLGINKGDLVDILYALDSEIFPDPTADARAKKEALEAGNLNIEGPVFCKKISFQRDYTDIGSLCDIKLYDLRIKEGEKSVIVVMVATKLFEYKDWKIAEPGFESNLGKYVFVINSKLYKKRKDNQ